MGHKPKPRLQEIEDRFRAAVEYADELLSGFVETTEPVPITVRLDCLTDEYWKAKQERRGMDPELVRIMVQGLIDAADFPAGNRPDEYDPEATNPAVPNLPSPIFRFLGRKGRKPLPPAARDGLSFTLGAVMERFCLTLYRNAEPALHNPLDGRISACDAVAEANRRSGRTPATYNSLRQLIGEISDRAKNGNGNKGAASSPAMEEGKLLGKAGRLMDSAE